MGELLFIHTLRQSMSDDFEFDEDSSLSVDAKRTFYVMIAAVLVTLIVLIALLGGGTFVVYSMLSDDGDTTSTNEPVTNPTNALDTTNPAQLCKTGPSGSQLNIHGEAIYPIPDAIVADMLNNGTWKEGCPVPISDLTLLHLPYWSCEEGVMKTGEMIVHLNVSNQIITIFDQLFVSKFPVYQMKLMSAFGGNDSLAMENNNTSSFNCREKTNKPGTFSLHSYGLAVDLNTFINPYVKDDIILPEGAAEYANRSIVIPGTIIGSGGVAYQAFTAQGWTWGGDWTTLQDYQHFEYDSTVNN